MKFLVNKKYVNGFLLLLRLKINEGYRQKFDLISNSCKMMYTTFIYVEYILG